VAFEQKSNFFRQRGWLADVMASYVELWRDFRTLRIFVTASPWK
jgi:hypothetical protein